MIVLPEPEWRTRAAAHRERVLVVTGPLPQPCPLRQRSRLLADG